VLVELAREMVVVVVAVCEADGSLTDDDELPQPATTDVVLNSTQSAARLLMFRLMPGPMLLLAHDQRMLSTTWKMSTIAGIDNSVGVRARTASSTFPMEYAACDWHS
jgi:hypothetical protein